MPKTTKVIKLTDSTERPVLRNKRKARPSMFSKLDAHAIWNRCADEKIRAFCSELEKIGSECEIAFKEVPADENLVTSSELRSWLSEELSKPDRLGRKPRIGGKCREFLNGAMMKVAEDAIRGQTKSALTRNRVTVREGDCLSQIVSRHGPINAARLMEAMLSTKKDLKKVKTHMRRKRAETE